MSDEKPVLILRDRTVQVWTPGSHPALAAALDPYHAANLLEALKLVPDTGDWHGSLRIACQMVLDEQPAKPNRTAEQMRQMEIPANRPDHPFKRR